MVWHLDDKKVAFSSFCVVVLMGAATSCHWFPELVGLYTSFVGGVTFIAGLYLAGNVASQHLSNQRDENEEVQAGTDPGIASSTTNPGGTGGSANPNV